MIETIDFEIDEFDATSQPNWISGRNDEADADLHRAREALHEGDDLRCFATVRVAMRKYGWTFHPDKKARRLWRRWMEIQLIIQMEQASCEAIELLFHEVFRAVHFDLDKRIRRNTPPRNPSALSRD